MFESLTNAQISALYSVLNDTIDQMRHEPSYFSEEDMTANSEMYSAVCDEAKKRRLW